MAYTHGKPYRSDLGSFFRLDTYTTTGSVDRLFVANMRDDSPLWRHWEPGKYNGEKCPSCYLGYAHSEAYHRQHTEN